MKFIELLAIIFKEGGLTTQGKLFIQIKKGYPTSIIIVRSSQIVFSEALLLIYNVFKVERRQLDLNWAVQSHLIVNYCKKPTLAKQLH